MDLNVENNNNKEKRSSFKLFLSDFHSKNNDNSDQHLQLSWSLIYSYLLMLSSIITLTASILIKWDRSTFILC